jgi:hypothetical protein
MNFWTRYGLFMLLAISAVMGLAASSSARSIPAFLGQPQQPGDYSCFTNASGSVTNNCAGVRQFCMSLPVDDATHTISISVRALDIDHNIQCIAQAVTHDGLNAGLTGFVAPGVFGTPQTITLSTLNVPSSGHLYACCNVSQTARIISVVY